MSINRWMFKKNVVHIYNGILLNHKKEHIWVSSNDVDENLESEWNKLEKNTDHTLTHTSWRRQWHPTPVLLPGKSHGQRSLVGYSPWGCQESDTTEWLHFLSNTHLWNLERWYWWTYLQGSNGDADREDRLMDTGGGKERVGRMERVAWKHIHYHM